MDSQSVHFGLGVYGLPHQSPGARIDDGSSGVIAAGLHAQDCLQLETFSEQYAIFSSLPIKSFYSITFTIS